MPNENLARRVVVTGLGAVTPIGNTATAFWENLLAGASGVSTISTFDPSGLDVRIAAHVKDFDPTVGMDRKMARRMSRFIQLGMASADPTRRPTPRTLGVTTSDEVEAILESSTWKSSVPSGT